MSVRSLYSLLPKLVFAVNSGSVTSVWGFGAEGFAAFDVSLTEGEAAPSSSLLVLLISARNSIS